MFAFSEKANDLREFWRIEIIRKPSFSWRRLIISARNNRRRRFLFWWRLANEMHIHGTRRQRKVATLINYNLKTKYSSDLGLGAVIGSGLHIPHHVGVVITERARIGCNFTVRQSTTIGRKLGLSGSDYLVIGDNVDVGANCCIIGNIIIGDNVKIGAISFINKNIPSNSTVYTKKTNLLIVNEDDSKGIYHYRIQTSVLEEPIVETNPHG